MMRLVFVIALGSAAVACVAFWNVWAPLGFLAGWGAMDIANEFSEWRDR